MSKVKGSKPKSSEEIASKSDKGDQAVSPRRFVPVWARALGMVPVAPKDQAPTEGDQSEDDQQ